MSDAIASRGEIPNGGLSGRHSETLLVNRGERVARNTCHLFLCAVCHS